MTEYKVNLNVFTSYDFTEIWEALGNSDFGYCNDFIYKINGYDSDNPSSFTIIHADTNGIDKVTTTVTTEKIAEAFKSAVINKETHCGSYSISDLDDSDSCFAYTILQYALYGKVVFG